MHSNWFGNAFYTHTHTHTIIVVNWKNRQKTLILKLIVSFFPFASVEEKDLSSTKAIFMTVISCADAQAVPRIS